MNIDTINYDTALIGCGYWGTNIAKVLSKIKKNKIIIYDEKHSNSIILKKRSPNKFIITKKLKTILKRTFSGSLGTCSKTMQTCSQGWAKIPLKTFC